jgi:hypothetical protein
VRGTLAGSLIVFATIAVVLFLLFEQNASGATTDAMTSAADTATPASQGVADLAAAITVAENSDPQYNNPGDLKVAGFPTFGAGIAIFSSPAQGLSRLYYQLNLIANGESSYYSLDMTIEQFAAVWTGNDNAAQWAQAVESELGVAPGTTLGDVLGS